MLCLGRNWSRKLKVKTLEQEVERITVMYLSQFVHPDVLPTFCNEYSSATGTVVFVREACMSTWYWGGGCTCITSVDLTFALTLRRNTKCCYWGSCAKLWTKASSDDAIYILSIFSTSTYLVFGLVLYTKIMTLYISALLQPNDAM